MIGREPATEGRPVRTAWVAILLIAAVKVAASMAFSERYGWHRDELYYVVAGRHPALGYVDFPPMTALVAGLTQLIAPDSLVALRLASVLAGTVAAIVAGLIARDLGGGPWAQALATFAVVVSPFYLVGDFLFGTPALDSLVWVLLLWVVVRILRGADRRLWLLAGLVLGIGFETKYTIAALAVALALGLLLTPSRAHLATPWPWLGIALAMLLLVPNLAWQATHDWISVAYTLHHSGNTGSRAAFWLEQILLVQPVLLPLVVAGAVWLWRSKTYRALFWTAILVELLLFVAKGKSYYPAGIYPLLYAAGGVWLERVVRSRRGRVIRVSWVAMAVLVTLLLLPIELPVLPPAAFAHSGLAPVQTDFTEMYGWPDFTRQVAAVYHSLPSSQRRHAMILASNYGEAGALDKFGPEDGVPASRVISPHLTFWYWAPARMNPTIVVTVGYEPAQLSNDFGSCSRAATVHSPYGIKDQEAGNPILICRSPRRPLWRSWPSLQTLD